MADRAIGSVIQLPDRIAASMLDHAAACAPLEACGLLSKDVDGRWSEFYPVSNAARSQSRFVMEPDALFLVISRVESLGGEVAGFFHSHPDGPAEPSQVDTVEWPDRTWVSFLGSLNPHSSEQLDWTLRAFELTGTSPRPMQRRLVIIESG